MGGVPSGGPERLLAGRYRLTGPLGQGAVGLVWRARDEVLGRDVAVKEVRAPEGVDPAEARRMYVRLEREARSAARITHRGVVRVYDVALEGGRPWIVMELVKGLSLAEVLEAEGPLPAHRAAHIGEQVLAALRSAHEAGVLHRDVKPGNVLVANDGRVLLSDFGLSTAAGAAGSQPEFLAPERVLGRAPGPESDLWSLGTMLHAAVAGASPFARSTPEATLRAVLDEEPPVARRAGELAPVIAGLLHKDPAARLSAPETARMLRIVGAGGSVRATGGPVSDPDGPLGGSGGSAGSGWSRGPGGGSSSAGGSGAVDGRGAPVGGPVRAPAAGAPVPAGPVSAADDGPAAGTSGVGAGLVLAVGVLALLAAFTALIWALLR
ncbi:serine/threonine-protein kinase [Streptomyces sp. NPDC093225]|uniref:serine/threonine-protein kinase n=1 Tax=Streptomyces sp. NPDC093225 TaxID=3366034 RepID=UPI00380B04E4